MLTATASWKSTHPQTCMGLLALSGVSNPATCPALEERKAALEATLRQRYAGMERSDLRALPVLQAYQAYYKRFKKSYHVEAQLESVALKGRGLPNVAALVEAMFVAELDSLLLTAGHDLDVVQGPLVLDAALGTESYTGLGGHPLTLKPNDMFVRDDLGVLSSIIYGPDDRTQIRPSTTRAVFTTYGPVGISPQAVWEHLKRIEALALLIDHDAEVEAIEVVEA